jgi:asparagine synthase (glutamine-hydrolysing)
MMLQDQREYLPGDLLAKVDRASMAASLEVRTPFLDHRVVEFAWTLPPECRIHSGRGKWILRRLLESRLPPHLRERPKVGFSVPLAAWLGGPLRPWAEGLLRSGRLSSSGVIDGRVAERMWMRFLGGQRHFATSIWALLVLIAWCEEHGVQM